MTNHDIHMQKTYKNIEFTEIPENSRTSQHKYFKYHEIHNPRRPPIVGSPTNPDNSTAALTAHMTSNKEWVPVEWCS